MSSPYSYLPLVERFGADCIRLCRLLPSEDPNAIIECRLFNYYLPHEDVDTHLYEALSYVWGAKEKDQPILVDGKTLSIRENLHLALSRLRNRHLDRVLWIDAICINQEDLDERASQIRYMAIIYGKAKCVNVWLGDSTGGADLALEQIDLAADSSRAVIPMYAKLRDGLDELFNKEWFLRIWVSVTPVRKDVADCVAGSSRSCCCPTHHHYVWDFENKWRRIL